MSKRKDSKGRVLKEGESQRPNGTYMYRTPAVKGEKRAYIYAKTLNELREKEEDLQRKSLNGIDISCIGMTVNDVYVKWYKRKRALSDNTLQNYRYMYEKYVADNFGKKKIVSIRKSDVYDFYEKLHDDNGLKPNTIDGIHTVLRQVFEFAVDDDIISGNPANRAINELRREYSSEVKKRVALTLDQEKKLLEYAKNSAVYRHWYPLLVVLFFTGMRAGELTALQYDDVDLKNKVIYIRHNLVYYAKGDEQALHRKSMFSMHKPKTSNGNRVIPMLPIVEEALRDHIKLTENAQVECKAPVDGYSKFVFLNRFGMPVTGHLINRAISRIIRDCNKALPDNEKLPDISCHYARHTFATRMLEAHMEHKARSSILGHTDEDITDRVYTDAFVGYLKEELRKMDSICQFFAG